VLYGREEEIRRLDSVITRARGGSGGALLLRGEAGMGKTALLEHAANRADGMRVLRATGVESESELAFAGVHQLLRPAIGLLDKLPDPQADGLRAALGLAAATSPDRFLIASGVLSLIAEAAADKGLLCLVDDVQWMDRASIDALLFAARRLDADPVAMVFAQRSGTGLDLDAPELAPVELGGLSAADAGSLLAARVPAAPAEAVAVRLADLTTGNPLALSEVARLLTADQLAGRAPLPEPLPVSQGLQRAFLGQARRLDPETQLALLVIATDTTGDLAIVESALDRLGVPGRRVFETEAAGLVTFDDTGLRFRHPLIRSAVTAGASHAQRRLVNDALAGALTAAGDPDRSVWHRAAAATGTDDGIAGELAAAARRATARGAHAAAASAYERAAQLSPAPAGKAERYAAAARAACDGAQPDRAYAALDAARPLATDPRLQAEIAELHGHLEWRHGDVAHATGILTDAAARMAGIAPARALAMLVEANYAASASTELGTVVTRVRLAETVDPGDDPVGRIARLAVLGYGIMLAGDAARATGLLRLVLTEAEDEELTHPMPLVWATSAALLLGDEATACRFAERAAQLARKANMTGALPFIYEYHAIAESARGHLANATALATEGIRIARETGQTNSAALHLSTLSYASALRGDFDTATSAGEEALALAAPRRLGQVSSLASWALAVGDIMRGRYPEALHRLTVLCRSDGPHSAAIRYSYLEWVEAAVRCGELGVAGEALDRLASWITGGSTPRLRALLLRSRALLAEDEADPLYRESLAVHPAGNAPVDRARTQLMYGEWLRRARRPADARPHLREALDTFVRAGAEPLAERTRGELRATGESTGRPAANALNQLTAQELQIARLVAAGASNRDVATRLFLSPRTVEYHLYKIYPKLGVASRLELARFLAHEQAFTPDQ